MNTVDDIKDCIATVRDIIHRLENNFPDILQQINNMRVNEQEEASKNSDITFSQFCMTSYVFNEFF